MARSDALDGVMLLWVIETCEEARRVSEISASEEQFSTRRFRCLPVHQDIFILEGVLCIRRVSLCRKSLHGTLAYSVYSYQV